SRDDVITTMYRPFVKKHLYYSKPLIHRTRNYKEVYGENNKIIFTTGTGISKDFSALVMKEIPNYHTLDTGKGYYRYQSQISNINSDIKNKYQLSEDELFWLVYRILHSPEYKKKFKHDLNKSIPRLPMVKNTAEFILIGKKLEELHLNYENLPLY